MGAWNSALPLLPQFALHDRRCKDLFWQVIPFIESKMVEAVESTPRVKCV